MHVEGPARSSASLGERLHTWTGAVPLAGFLLAHLLAQLSALGGPLAHARVVAREASLGWALLEIVLVYVPLALHASLGLWRALWAAGARRPSAAELAQWLSAAVLLVFSMAHVWQLRAQVWLGTLSPADYYPELCASLSSTAWGGVPLVAIGYLLGVAAAAVHGAGGIYRAALRSGCVGRARERLLRRCCGALGVVVFVLGALIVIDLATGSVLIHLRGS